MNAVKVIPAPLKLTVDWKGSISFKLKLTQKGNGLPVNAATSKEIWFTAKNDIADDDASAIVKVTKTGGGIIASGDDNNIITVTANLVGASLTNSPASLICDCKFKGADDYVQVIAKGTLSIVPVITQAIA